MLVAMGVRTEEGTYGLQRASFCPYWLSAASGATGHRKMIKCLPLSSTDLCPLCVHIQRSADGSGHGDNSGAQADAAFSGVCETLLPTAVGTPGQRCTLGFPWASTLMAEAVNTLEVSPTSVSTLLKAGTELAMAATPGGSSLGCRNLKMLSPCI